MPQSSSSCVPCDCINYRQGCHKRHKLCSKVCAFFCSRSNTMYKRSVFFKHKRPAFQDMSRRNDKLEDMSNRKQNSDQPALPPSPTASRPASAIHQPLPSRYPFRSINGLTIKCVPIPESVWLAAPESFSAFSKSHMRR